jgi:hypothetical protein
LTSESVLNYFTYYGNRISVCSVLTLEVHCVPKVGFQVSYYEFGADFLKRKKNGLNSWASPCFNHKGAKGFCTKKFNVHNSPMKVNVMVPSYRPERENLKYYACLTSGEEEHAELKFSPSSD